MVTPHLFHMFTQSIKCYALHYHVLGVQMFKKYDSSNRTVKINGCSFQQVLRQNLGWFLSLHWKTLFLRSFILNSTEGA